MASPDAIADAVLEQFDKLPQKSRPRKIGDGYEWVPIAGVTLSDGTNLRCVALGLGMKCLPLNKIGNDGRAIHDSHAEVLALRAFNLFLVEECLKAASDSSEFIRKESSGSGCLFELRPGWTIDMYCSEAPCGDASMELIMDLQADATPWPVTPGVLPGREFFSELGIVRRKPARRDAPISNSKSCSDKLALKQTISLLSSVTAVLFEPAAFYLDRLVIPESRLSKTGCERAFGATGRLNVLHGRDFGKFQFQPFQVVSTKRRFRHERTDTTASNICAYWTPHSEETVINGFKLGRRPADPSAASRLSKLRMFEMLQPLYIGALKDYASFKSSQVERERTKRLVRQLALKNWVQNGDNDFSV